MSVEVGSFLGMGGGTAVVGVLTVVAVVQVGVAVFERRVEQRDVHGGRDQNPKRNLPLSLAIGTGAVSLLYIACNFVYLSVLPMSGIANAPQDRVATAVMEAAFGRGRREADGGGDPGATSGA